MNLDNLTPAQEKAIAAGGTNNAVIGNSLMKRGVMERGNCGETKFVLSDEFVQATLESHDPFEGEALPEPGDVEHPDTDPNAEEIAALRAEFPSADEARKADIAVRLATFGTVVFPPGTPEYAEYSEKLHAAVVEFTEGVVDPEEEWKIARGGMPTPESIAAVAELFGPDPEEERKYAETIEKEENDQEAAAQASNEAFEAEQYRNRFLGPCRTCGTEVFASESDHEEDEDSVKCGVCVREDVMFAVTKPMAPLTAAPVLAPRADCADPDCAVLAVHGPAEGQFDGQLAYVPPAESPSPAPKPVRVYAGTLDTDLAAYRLVSGPRGNHLQLRPPSALCGRSIFGRTAPADLDQVDCIGCLDEFTERTRPKS